MLPKKLVSISISLTLFLSACSGPQVVIKHIPTPGNKLRVAVLPFKDAPGQPGTGEMAAETMTTYLLHIPAYEMIERSALEQVIKEQNLGITGALDPQTATTLGKVLGADALVVGAVTEFKQRNFMIFPPAKATINVRLVRTDTATVDWSATYTLGWHPVKWMSSFFWPLGVVWVMTSPTAEDRLHKAARKIVKKIEKKSRLE